jgi:3-oxoacyl-[acyl-carrier protein] reductase
VIPSTFSLADKNALVTGGSRGIGAAVAKLLAQRGATVAITYSRSAGRAEEILREIEAAGGKAFSL